MNTAISLEDKKLFVRWFLKQYKMKRRECVWILNYVLPYEHLLENIHFVEEAHHCPRAMVMSTTETESIPFRFYKGNLMSADAEKAFHDLRLNPDEKMYVQLNFPNKSECAEYQNVLEENGYNPNEIQATSEITEETEMLMSEIMKDANHRSLIDKIDKALDSGDEELFIELSSMLNQLGEQNEKTENNKTISFSA